MKLEAVFTPSANVKRHDQMQCQMSIANGDSNYKQCANDKFKESVSKDTEPKI